MGCFGEGCSILAHAIPSSIYICFATAENTNVYMANLSIKKVTPPKKVVRYRSSIAIWLHFFHICESTTLPKTLMFLWSNSTPKYVKGYKKVTSGGIPFIYVVIFQILSS